MELWGGGGGAGDRDTEGKRCSVRKYVGLWEGSVIGMLSTNYSCVHLG